jgi:hypothetical protein
MPPAWARRQVNRARSPSRSDREPTRLRPAPRCARPAGIGSAGPFAAVMDTPRVLRCVLTEPPQLVTAHQCRTARRSRVARCRTPSATHPHLLTLSPSSSEDPADVTEQTCVLGHDLVELTRSSHTPWATRALVQLDAPRGDGDQLCTHFGQRPRTTERMRRCSSSAARLSRSSRTFRCRSNSTLAKYSLPALSASQALGVLRKDSDCISKIVHYINFSNVYYFSGTLRLAGIPPGRTHTT